MLGEQLARYGFGDGHPFGVTALILDVDGDKVTPGRVYTISRMGAFCGGCNAPFN